MQEEPLRVLVCFTVCYWFVMSWLFTQCERYNRPAYSDQFSYLNSLWVIVITFMCVGYGDVVPQTYCGRAIAISTAIMGIGVASALVAVISRKLDLSKAEKHVNAFMADTKLTRERKNAAASVLQEMWFIYKYRYLLKCKDEIKIRYHQRKFLSAITEFRRIKWEQRKLTEQSNMLIDIAKIQTDLQDAVYELQVGQQNMLNQMSSLLEKVQALHYSILHPPMATTPSIAPTPPPQIQIVQPHHHSNLVTTKSVATTSIDSSGGTHRSPSYHQLPRRADTLD